MKKGFMTLAICLMAAVSTFAQHTTRYYNGYGSSTGSATTGSDYGGGFTTTYYDSYGRTIGTSHSR